MSPERENFDSLRRLLALKRYEQPPPGYFDRLPRRIMARIQGGETGGIITFADRVTWEAPWLQRILAHLESRPAIGAAFAVAMCVFLISGLILSDKRQDLPVLTISGSQQPTDQKAISLESTSVGLFGHTPEASQVSITGVPAGFSVTSPFDAFPPPKGKVLKYSVSPPGN